MAKIDWTPRFLRLLYSYIDNASIEYGQSTANKWAEEVYAFEQRVESYPTSYSPEHLLKERSILYRSCHVMNRRFKLIYYYDEAKDVVHLVDIWDTKMNPKALIHRIK